MKLNELRALIQEAIAEETSNKFSIKDKLNNILFGKDEKGVDGYLSQEWRLKRDITPKERSLRIALIIDQLKNYIKSLEEVANDEETFVKATTNEGFFGPSKKDIADFEAELEALIKDKKLENAPDLEKMKEKVRATAKTSGFKGGKLGYQAAGTNKRTGNKIPPQFYYSTDSTTTGR